MSVKEDLEQSVVVPISALSYGTFPLLDTKTTRQPLTCTRHLYATRPILYWRLILERNLSKMLMFTSFKYYVDIKLLFQHVVLISAKYILYSVPILVY